MKNIMLNIKLSVIVITLLKMFCLIIYNDHLFLSRTFIDEFFEY